MHILIHSKSDCPSCTAAKAYFAEHAVPYEEILHDDWDARQALYDRLGLLGGQRTVPQIFVDGERLGGWRELAASDVAARQQIHQALSEDF